MRTSPRCSLFSLFVVGAFLGASDVAASWTPNGTPVAVAYKNQIDVSMAADGAGGAFLAWSDSRNTPGPYHAFQIYAQRMSATGNPLWTGNGIPISNLTGNNSGARIVSDGLGGVILAWTRSSGEYVLDRDVYVQRVDASGNLLWGATGLNVSTASGNQWAPDLVGDGSGGAIVAWTYDSDIYARRISADGSSAWSPAVTGVCVKPYKQVEPSMVSDGLGGAIIAWEDSTADAAARYNISAQRIASNGAAMWALNGVSICSLPGQQWQPSIVDDGVGGAVILWLDYRTGTYNSDVYIQRINNLGAVQWALNGIPVCTAPNSQVNLARARVGNQFVVAWSDARDDYADVYAQRFDMSGNALWAANGIAVAAAAGNQSGPSVVSDGTGGVYLAWTDIRNMVDDDVYAQHLNSNGTSLWVPNGVAVVDVEGTQVRADMVSDGSGGVILSWTDSRTLDPDVYAQHLGPSVTAVEDSPPAALAIRPNYPNPFAGMTSIEIHLPAAGDVALAIYDVTGKRVRTGSESFASGWNRLDIRGEDNAGHPLPSGVYFLQISGSGTMLTRKIVIAR